MHRLIATTSGISLTLAALAAPLSAAAAEPSSVKTKISAVTVYADRAQVTRVGAVDLSAATSGEILVDALPGWIDHESIRVTLSKGTILDVAPKTMHLAKAAAESVRNADAAVQAVNDSLRVINDDKTVVRSELDQLRALRAFTTQKLPRDVASRRVKMKEVAETLDFIAQRMKNAQKRLRDLDAKRRDLMPELNKLTKERNELRSQSLLKKTRVVVGVKGSGRAKLTIVYMTTGAVWEPGAELRVKQSKRATLVQHASVVNTTGEDWVGAKLSFSTQRPGEMLTVPAAKALLIGGGGGGGKGLGAVVGRLGGSKGQSFDKASSAYVQQNMAVEQNRSKWQAGYRRQQAAQQRALQAFKALKKRGTTAHFSARSARAVRSNGKSVRVPITDDTFQMTTKLVAVPEVSLNVVRTAQLTNSGTQPILPGVVALFVDGAFLGKSTFDFVAPGETFSAFLGVDDGIKITRDLDRKRSKMERGRKRTEVVASWVIRAYNLKNTPVELYLSDRLPVSSDGSIEIDDTKIPKGASRARDGLVRWVAKLGPKKSGAYRVEYALEYANTMAVQAKRERQMRRKKRRNTRTPAPAKSSKEYLFDAIDDLEKAF